MQSGTQFPGSEMSCILFKQIRTVDLRNSARFVQTDTRASVLTADLLDGHFHTVVDAFENGVLLGFGQRVEGLRRIVGCLELPQLRVLYRARADCDPKNRAAAVLSILEEHRELLLANELGGQKVLRDQQYADTGGLEGMLNVF